MLGDTHNMKNERTYDLNENYFHNIDTPEKAYWLGFIITDGNIIDTNRAYKLQIRLAISDKEHLELLANHLGYTGNISIVKHGTAANLTVCSKILVHDLESHGVVPRKTFICKPWIGDNSLMSDFWRGAFDGDGGFSITQRTKPNGSKTTLWNSQLTGTLDMVSAFGEFIRINSSEHRMGSIKRHGNMWDSKFSGPGNCKAVVEAIYTNPSIYLPRKLKLAQAIRDHIMPINVIACHSDDELLSLYSQYKNWGLVADYIGVSRIGMYDHARKKGFPRRKMAKWTRK